MAPLQKQPLSINFSQGIETKVDPFQLPAGKFTSLKNSVFDKAGRLTKRNGYGKLKALPDNESTYLTTFKGNLTAVGSSIYAYSDGTNQWVDKGSLTPIDLSVLPAIRNSTNQSQSDSVTASNGLTCIAYTDQNPASLGANIHRYTVIDSNTGQSIVDPTTIASTDPTYGTPRVFLLGNYFIIIYTTQPAAYQLVYIAVSINNPTVVTSPVTISSDYIPSTTVNFDGIVVNNRLFVAYNTTSGGQAIKVTYISQSLGNPATATTFAAAIATMFSLCADMSVPASPVIYVSYYDLVGTSGSILAIDQNLNTVKTPVVFASAMTIRNLASTATDGVVTVYYERSNQYSYSSTYTNYISSRTMTVAGTLGTAAVVVRSVGLASKAFTINSVDYFLAIYNSGYQPTYFLINSSGKVVSILSAANGGTYYTKGLPNVTVNDTIAKVSYLYKDRTQAINRTQGSTTPGIYAQLGINEATFNIGVSTIISAEIGNNLNLTGGFLGMYDGIRPVEQGFFLYPEDMLATPVNSGGSMAIQQYYYQVTYEWADNQGNIFRSSPSLPLSANVTGGGGSASVTLDIPTLRLTYKTAVPVKIVIYRWSTGQQNYYQVTSISSPLLNSTTTDSVTYTDTQADSAIIGNNLLYTTGAVVENIVAPATSNACLFNNRLFLVDAEDRNLLWYSKQVIEATAVEMSDLLTIYAAPTTASQGSTGTITAIAPMDDKLIVFKRNALGYISGVGPDSTGANSQYSDYTLINSVVGSTNQQSIVFTPQGLMFQSAKGMWILKRDLSTDYIGSPVESLTQGATVQSAVNIPGSTQVRFTLDTGITLVYDYFFGQWGSFTNVPAISSTLYENLHTYLNSSGNVFQETPGIYLDNASPVLMSFQTGWINLAGLQGYERFYSMYLLGKYISPFKLAVQIAYDYNSSVQQSTIVTPNNYAAAYGDEQLWGSGPTWGGTPNVGWEASANVFEARIFPERQKCESFQISLNESYDASYGQAAGEGLTLSGLNLIVGLKKVSRTSPASRSFG